jgi:Transglycosylase-like domain/Putative peptidoglycan binding domain
VPGVAHVLSASPTANPVGGLTKGIALTIKQHAPLAARTHDIRREGAVQRSLSGLRARGAARAHRRAARVTLRRRATVALTALVATGLAGAALAATPASTSAASVLHVGSRGPAVAALQRKLGIAADGVYGPQTRRAVMAFQRHHGLDVDGVAGPATLHALGLPAADGDGGRATGAGASDGASPTLRRIASCESGGNPRAISPDGRYRGKYQFDVATWRAMGGTGDPAAASEAEQDRIAAKLLAARGTAPWPTCG